MSNQLVEIVTKKAFRAIGMKWSGIWADMQQLKRVIQKMIERVEHTLKYGYGLLRNNLDGDFYVS